MSYPASVIESPHGDLSATFLTGLGMVCSSFTHRGEELLAQRGGPEAYAERGSTFGIPLLYPWANRLSAWSYAGADGEVTLDEKSPVVHIDGATGLPSHGLLAANRNWVTTSAGDGRLEAELDFAADPALMAAFPFAHRLRFRAALGNDALLIGLTVIPAGPEPVPISFGFHPYLTLAGSDRRSWTIEAPVRRRALLDERGLPLSAHEQIEPGAIDGPLADRTFDDCFDELIQTPAAPAVFAVADQRHRLAVTFRSGYEIAQIYAPHGSDFICFEPMTAPVDALRSGRGLRFAAPGASFSADFMISVSPVR